MSYDLTIIIPFFNSKKNILKNFSKYLKISKKYKIETIYIDNNSTDNTFLIINKKISNFSNIKIFKTNKKLGMGPGIARNLGVTKSNSNNILFVDSDDYLIENLVNKLIRFTKTNNFNLIYLNKISKLKLSPYNNYNKVSLKKFFRNSTNMQSIAIVFKKKFLIKNKLKFKKGIYEDIFYLFKCHFYNKKKIGFFKHKIYIKENNRLSITNALITLNHINFKFKAWKSIVSFLRKNLKRYNFEILKNDIQYRLRGEFYYQYKEIISSKIKKTNKVLFVNHLKKLYKKIISEKFVDITYKDKHTKKKLFNV